jgi:hypothetical protein
MNNLCFRLHACPPSQAWSLRRGRRGEEEQAIAKSIAQSVREKGFFAMRSALCAMRIFTPTSTLLNPCVAGFAVGEIQQGDSSPVEGEESLSFPDGH